MHNDFIKYFGIFFFLCFSKHTQVDEYLTERGSEVEQEVAADITLQILDVVLKSEHSLNSQQVNWLDLNSSAQKTELVIINKQTNFPSRSCYCYFFFNSEKCCWAFFFTKKITKYFFNTTLSIIRCCRWQSYT